MNSEIKVVTREELSQIIETRLPKGLFLTKESDDCIVAVDNQSGDAWTEEFPSEELARKWLNGNDAVLVVLHGKT